MTLKPGDIARVKISGELVQVRELFPNDEGYLVLRAVGKRDDVEYKTAIFALDALETTEQSIDREFAEALYRWKLQRKGVEIEKLSDEQDEMDEAMGGEPEPEDEPLN